MIYSLSFRYLIYPALLACLLSKVKYTPKDRQNNLLKTASFYLKFLKLTKDYSLHNFRIPNLLAVLTNANDSKAVVQNGANNLDRDLIKCAYDRNEKIRRFKEQKEFEKQLEVMKTTCKNEHVDEEQKRTFYLTCIKYWINVSVEEIKCLVGK